MKYQLWLDTTESAKVNFKEIQGGGLPLSQYFLPTYDITWKAPFPLPKTAYISLRALSLGTEISKFKGGNSGGTQDKINLEAYTGFNCYSALTFNMNVSGRDVMDSDDTEDTWGHTGDDDITGPLTSPFPSERAPKPKQLTPIGVAEVWKSVAQNFAQFMFPDVNPPTFLTSSIFGATPLTTLIRIQQVRQLVNFNNPNEIHLVITAPQKFQNQNDGANPIFKVNDVGKSKFFNLDIPHNTFPLFTANFGLNSSAYLPFDSPYKICIDIEPVLSIERPIRTTKWLWIDSRKTLRVGRLGFLAKERQTPNYQGYNSSPIKEDYRFPTFDLFYKFPFILEGLYSVRVACFNLGVQVKGMGEDQILPNSCYDGMPMFNSLYVNSEFSSAYVGDVKNFNPLDPETQDTSLFSVPINPLEPFNTYNLTSIGKVNAPDFGTNPSKYFTSRINGLGTGGPSPPTEAILGQLSAVPVVSQLDLESTPKVFNMNPSQTSLHIVLTTNNFLQLLTNSPEVFENWRLPYYTVAQYMPSTAHPTPNAPTDNFYLPMDLPYTACIEISPC
tara:strand:+ start:2041 stop:3711 length:1671 start_codon:yes stop_codon:yes gene_type:complete